MSVKNKIKRKLKKLVKKGLNPKKKFKPLKSGRNTWLGYEEGDDGWVQQSDGGGEQQGGGGAD